MACFVLLNLPADAISGFLAIAGFLRREKSVERGLGEEARLQVRGAETHQVLRRGKESARGPLVTIVHVRLEFKAAASLGLVKAGAPGNVAGGVVQHGV